MSIGKLLRSLAIFVIFLLVSSLAALTLFATNDRANDYPILNDGLSIPSFDNESINFIPTYDGTRTLPFTAGAIIDIDNDGIEEVFFGGGLDQQDAIYSFKNNTFIDITVETGWKKDTPDKTYSAISLDLDIDGDTDMLVTRQSGVFLYRNDGGRFAGQKLDLDLDAETVPLSVAAADINRDGLYDLYISGYIARQYVQGETIFNATYGGVSGLFINTGADTFENITEEAGMLYQHNTFQSVFLDIDDDGLEDIVVAHDTGQVRTWKNMGDLKFQNMSNPTSDYFSYPMGIAVTDLKNDGLPDFFFSNVGSTVPEALVRGDLTEDQVLQTDWIFFENQGGFKFDDSAESAHLADYEFSWGAIFEDFNLDGRDDLVVSENYEGWPLHKLPMWRLNGRFMLQNETGQFSETGEAAGVINREYGISPLTADFNQDGHPDLIHVNLLGPQNVFLSKAGDNGYLKIKLTNDVSSIGSEAHVTLEDGTTLVQTFVVGEGLLSDQSHVLIFGLGGQKATRVMIKTIDGEERVITGAFHNQLLDL